MIFDWTWFSRVRIKRRFPAGHIFNETTFHISSWIISGNNKNPVFAWCNSPNTDLKFSLKCVVLEPIKSLDHFYNNTILALTFFGTLPGELSIIISFSIISKKTIAKSIFLIPPWFYCRIQMLFPCIPRCVRRLKFSFKIFENFQFQNRQSRNGCSPLWHGEFRRNRSILPELHDDNILNLLIHLHTLVLPHFKWLSKKKRFSRIQGWSYWCRSVWDRWEIKMVLWGENKSELIR